ncbi:MAG: hypothetical protein K2X41_01310 [Hyphomicrobium sp.]|nr:hypothetical protein [Hyphomicrobium sp.]
MAVVVLCAALGGCASQGSLGSAFDTSGSLSLPTIELPKLAAAEPTAPIGSTSRLQPVGSATEVYSRIARGAVQCWFGATGPFKKDFIYHADADAPSRGGKAEIVLHVREPAQPNPRGAKAYRIKIEPAGETSVVETENLRLPEPTALALNGDVGRWSNGEQGCAGATTAVGWSPKDDTVVPAAVPAAAKTKAKSKSASAKQPGNQ